MTEKTATVTTFTTGVAGDWVRTAELFTYPHSHLP